MCASDLCTVVSLFVSVLFVSVLAVFLKLGSLCYSQDLFDEGNILGWKSSTETGINY